mgnify:CR=1 FL=1|tara:strand:- start:324 stop:524 length:201 start_codon:yes stop_codon:yes gene_type:complete
MLANQNGLIKVSKNNLYSIVSNYTYVDEYLLYDDVELAKYFRSLVIKGIDKESLINKLIKWVNNNY